MDVAGGVPDVPKQIAKGLKRITEVTEEEESTEETPEETPEASAEEGDDDADALAAQMLAENEQPASEEKKECPPGADNPSIAVGKTHELAAFLHDNTADPLTVD